jgi:hypothetical protein
VVEGSALGCEGLDRRAEYREKMVTVDRRGVEALCTTVRERVLRDAKVA